MMLKVGQFFLVLLLTLFFLPRTISAVTVAITNIPEAITDQPFEFNVDIAGAQDGTNYLRADLYVPETHNYFGYTFNGNDFYNGSDYSLYLPITINSEGSGSATIQAKLDAQSNNFKGSGTYSLKVRRYTSQNSYTWSNEATVEIDYSIATPTPTPTEVPTPSPTPTQTPSPTKSPTKVPTKKPTPSPTGESSPIDQPSSILGTSASATQTPTPTTIPSSNTSFFSFSNLLIGAGVLVSILSAVFVYTLLRQKKIPKL